MRKEKKKNKSRKKRAALLLIAGLAGGGALTGLVGTNAFFTDHAATSSSTNVGTLNMKLENYSDLDGQYGAVAASGAGAGTVTTLLNAKEGYQGVTYNRPAAKDASNPSTGIINPGDNGVYGYKITNTAEKSFDTAKTVTVTLKAKSAAFSADADKSVYQIKGLGTPFISVSDDKTTCTLKYAQADTQVLSGSKETDGPGMTAVYQYDTLFDRNAKNKFIDMDVTINTTVYAKQHRNSIDSGLSVDAKTGNWVGTGDWTAIGSFETVVD